MYARQHLAMIVQGRTIFLARKSQEIAASEKQRRHVLVLSATHCENFFFYHHADFLFSLFDFL